MSTALDQFVDREGAALIPEPFTPGQELLVDLAGNGKRVSDLSGLSVGYKLIKEVCLGIRTAVLGSPAAGSGSWDDPYNVSSAASLLSILNIHCTSPNTLIRIRDGLIPWVPHSQWYLRPGCCLIGAGNGATVLQLDPSFGTGANVQLFCVGAPADSVGGNYVADLTIDGNYHSLDIPPTTNVLDGVALYGSYNVIENVAFRNGYGNFAAGAEHFGLIIQGERNNRISNGRCESFKGDYGTGLFVSGDLGSPGIGGIIENSEVKDYVAASNDFSNTHVAGITCLGGTVRSSVTDGCQVGFYAEKGNSVKLIGCDFLNCKEIGVDFNPTAIIKGVELIGNTIELRDDQTRRWGVRIGSSNDGVRDVLNTRIIANRIYQKSTGSPVSPTLGSYPISYNPVAGKGHILIGNTLDAQLNYHNEVITTDTVSIGNRGLAGETLTYYPDQNFGAPLPTKLKFSAQGTGSQTIPSGVGTKLLFTVVVQSGGGALVNSVFTAPRDGDYTIRVYAQQQFDNLSGYTQILLYKNGTPIQAFATLTGLKAGNALTGTVRITLGSGDAISIYAYQNSGSSGDLYLSYPGSFQGNEL